MRVAEIVKEPHHTLTEMALWLRDMVTQVSDSVGVPWCDGDEMTRSTQLQGPVGR